MTLRYELHGVLGIAALLVLQACVSTSPRALDETTPPEPDLGILWVRNSAEYVALATQAFVAAASDLRRLLSDTSWSAMPGQSGRAGHKPAIIFDIDETLVNNVEFQVTLEPPFSEAKFDAWHEANRSIEVPGAAAFVRRARAAGVELFFVTNRSCVPAGNDPCPQERIAIDDLREIGIEANPASVMLSDEQPDWTQEKQVRRDLIARDYRVIMVFGDDLGDFLPCVRARIYAPCTDGATQETRRDMTQKYAIYWGNGWYILPNPMYGSWVAAQ